MVNRACLASSIIVASVVATGCNVEPTAPASTGGIDAGQPVASCDHGVSVVMTDYASTQIALSALDGKTLSSAFLSTASTKTSGVSYALSGDVVVPSSTPTSGRVVLLDRYGTNVVTWADPSSAKVLAQLPVGTGFESNPQDYLEIDATRAYVTRWGGNAKPGAAPFDGGNDVLIVDTQKPAILGRIEMPGDEDLPPRPAGMVRVGDTVIVLLQRLSSDFKSMGDAVLVGLKGDAIAWKQTVKGLKGCARFATAPSGKVVALACEGQLGADGSVVDLGAAAIVTFDVTGQPPKEIRRYPISDQLGDGPADHLAFASETAVLSNTQTSLGGARDNQAFVLDLSSGKAKSLATASKDASGKGKGVVYGVARCAIGCGDVCLMPDADLGKLRRWSIGGGGTMRELDPITVETAVGLPPVSLGGF